MKRYTLLMLLGALVFWSGPGAQAKVKGDAYLGYSRAGQSLYGPNNPGMNGLQFALQVRPTRFVGVEGEVSHYSLEAGAGGQQVTLIMFGPRATVRAAGVDFFAHVLGGLGLESDNEVYGFGTSQSHFGSYAFGGGADVPMVSGFKLRVTGDYLDSTITPTSGSDETPSRYRVGVGVAYHF
jgi:hypothetical protein